MRMHYCSKADCESLVEIDREEYTNLLKTKTGQELAIAVASKITVIETDPRQSELNNTDAFFSYIDVADGITSPEELLEELN